MNEIAKTHRRWSMRGVAGLTAALFVSSALAWVPQAGAQVADEYRFDFGPVGGLVEPGFTEVTQESIYTEDAGFGFVSVEGALDRDRGESIGNHMQRDWVGGPELEFLVDLEPGTYDVRVTVGDTGQARTDLTLEGEFMGTISARNEAVTSTYEDIAVEDGQLNVHFTGNPGRINGLEITPASGEEPIDEPTSHGVDVHVDIGISGSLTMSIGAGEMTLGETETDEGYRLFEGRLPEVTVTDTRSVAPEGAMWYVLGQASSFEGDAGQDPISADHLGWEPVLVTDDDEGLVAPGPRVDTVLDEGPNDVGLEGDELLALALDSGEAAATGEWKASADLFLKTPLDVAPGEYSSLLTISLFEESY